MCRSIWMAALISPLGLATVLAGDVGGGAVDRLKHRYRWVPMLALPAIPTEPLTSATTSEMISPYRFGVTITSYRSGAVATRAVPISIICWFASISGYSCGDFIKDGDGNKPSVIFMMLSLIMQVIFLRPYVLGRIQRRNGSAFSLPGRVMSLRHCVTSHV